MLSSIPLQVLKSTVHPANLVPCLCLSIQPCPQQPTTSSFRLPFPLLSPSSSSPSAAHASSPQLQPTPYQSQKLPKQYLRAPTQSQPSYLYSPPPHSSTYLEPSRRCGGAGSVLLVAGVDVAEPDGGVACSCGWDLLGWGFCRAGGRGVWMG